MSIKIMSAIFDSETLAPTERLIMLALADHADDTGRCYPSIQRLCQRTGLTERAVQSNIKKLQAQGYIKVVPGGGKGRPNIYFVSANPAAETPYEKPRITNTVSDDTQTPHLTTPNPAADAPEPSVTTIEPSAAVREPAVSQPSRRERILEAMGVDSSGITPAGKFIGTAAHMAEPPKWDALGLTEDDQLSVIRSQMDRGRCRDPSFMPGSFAYFTGAMSDLAAAKARGVPPPKTLPQQSERDQHKARLRKLAGR